MLIHDRETENEIPVFKIEDRGYSAEAWYLKNTETSKGDALIRIFKDGNLLREFLFQAYKIWNISAHFSDIIDGELENSGSGYEMAASTGF